MTNELMVIEKETNISQETSIALKQEFMPLFERAAAWKDKAMSIVVTSEDQVKDMETAREARLEMKRLRCETEAKRKELKDESLRKGKAIDGMANIIKYLIIPIEEHLQKQEDFVKIKIEREKAERLSQRIERVTAYGADVSMYNLADMTEDSFQTLLSFLKEQEDDKKKKAGQEAADRIERDRKEAEERERVRKENERLKQEAAEREKQAAEERKKQEEALAKERAKAAEERKKREAIEAEQEQKKREEEKTRAREAKKKADEEAARKKAERGAKLAPDKKKLEALAVKIAEIELPGMKSPEAKKILVTVTDMLNKVSAYIKSTSIELEG